MSILIDTPQLKTQHRRTIDAYIGHHAESLRPLVEILFPLIHNAADSVEVRTAPNNISKMAKQIIVRKRNDCFVITAQHISNNEYNIIVKRDSQVGPIVETIHESELAEGAAKISLLLL